MGLKDTFNSQGGKQLLRQYHKQGSLFTTISEFLLLGKSNTALEILRLTASLKAVKHLKKKYNLDEFESNYVDKPHLSSNKIWVCWFQGLDKAPHIVRSCVQSIIDHNPSKEVVILSNDNIYDYIQFPDYIQEKINRGIINGPHLSDLIRIELLIKYGGTWIDATVFCSDVIPDYIFNNDLFMFQMLKPGKDGNSNTMHNWLINATSNNKLLLAEQYLLYKYWQDYNEVIDYFIFNNLFNIVIEKYPKEWDKVYPVTNSTPHILWFKLFKEYDEDTWNCIKSQTSIHKLSHKISEDKYLIPNTYYERIVK